MAKILKQEQVILGVDPGTNVMGYGAIQETKDGLVLLGLGSVHFRRSEDSIQKLQRIQQSMLELIDSYLPDVIAIEAPFYGKNIQSMLKLGRAQGVAMASGMMRDIPVFEYAPTSVKLAITGSGKSSKEQVGAMALRMVKKVPRDAQLDATDALAIGICHTLRQHLPGETKKKGKKPSSDWGSFLKNNPDRER